MTPVLIKSAPERLCIDPATGRPLPPEGASVVMDDYWRRRLKDGDIEIVTPVPVKGLSKPVYRKQKES